MSSVFEREPVERLVGIYRHYCPDWDFMAIDEHSPELEGCTCDFTKQARQVSPSEVRNQRSDVPEDAGNR